MAILESRLSSVTPELMPGSSRSCMRYYSQPCLSLVLAKMDTSNGIAGPAYIIFV
jgi:hypothetical protein